MRPLSILLGLVLCIALAGCATIMPAQLTVNESYLTHPDAYEVLGQVEGSSTVSAVFFFLPSGNAGYRSAMDKAVQSAHADGLINVVADVEYREMFLFRTLTTTVRGLAIKKK